MTETPTIGHNETILVVEDEKLIRMTVRERLRKEGFLVEEAAEGRPAVEKVKAHDIDLILLDYRLPDIDGIEVLRRVREIDVQVPVVFLTAFSSVESVVDAIKLGAYDYLTKPVDHDHLLAVISKALETNKLRREVVRLRGEQRQVHGVATIVGSSPATQAMLTLVRKVCSEAVAATVLLEGESGTGKDLVAKTIHYGSSRADGPFMNITCSALPETLLESELFGHERGAFTDAKRDKKGLLELADGGTVFLDEVSEMGISPQSKLLRFLEERAFKRVGGSRDIHVDVRVVAATNRNLEDAVRQGLFRQDLFYRLNVIPVRIPPLRERRGDVPELVDFFIDQFNREFKKNTQSVSPEAMACLVRYDWPGNVRELRNVIERAMILETKPELDVDDLPESIVHGGETGPGVAAGSAGLFELPEGGVPLREVERDLVEQALARSGGNQSQAARLLHISRDALRYKMKKFGLG